MNRGMIVKIGLTRSIVMNDALEMVSIHKKPGMVKGMCIYYLDEDLTRGTVGQQRFWLRYAAIAAMLFLLVLTVQYAQLPTPYLPETFAVVTMDINPSIEMDVNSGGKVIGIRALNNDGASLLVGSFEALTVEEALERLLQMAKAQGYLPDAGAVLLASTQGKKVSENAFDVSDVVTDFISTHNSEYTFMYYEGNEKELALAREESLSLGRYKMNHLINDDLIDDAALNTMPISAIANNREMVAQLQAAQNKGEVKMFRAGEMMNEEAPRQEAPVGDSVENRTASELEEAYSRQNQYQINNQEKEGGGGQNTDNGQQQTGGNAGTNGKGNNNGAGNSQQGIVVEPPKGTTDASLDVNIIVESPEPVNEDDNGMNGQGSNGENNKGSSGGKGGKSGK